MVASLVSTRTVRAEITQIPAVTGNLKQFSLDNPVQTSEIYRNMQDNLTSTAERTATERRAGHSIASYILLMQISRNPMDSRNSDKQNDTLHIGLIKPYANTPDSLKISGHADSARKRNDLSPRSNSSTTGRPLSLPTKVCPSSMSFEASYRQYTATCWFRTLVKKNWVCSLWLEGY